MIHKKEIRSLTGIRGIAAIYVVLHHYFMGLSMSNPFSTFLAHGYLAVDVFFILSGFVMALNYAHMFSQRWSIRSYFKFLGRRIARVYPLYVAGTLCGLALILVHWLGPLQSRSMPANLAANLLMMQAWGFGQSFDAPAWSISAEWAAYLLFPLLLIPTLFKKPAVAWLSSAFSVLALVILVLLPASLLHNSRPIAVLDFHDSWAALPVLRCILEFSLGLVTYRLAATPFALRFGRRQWVSVTLCLISLVLLAIPRADLFFVLLIPPVLISLASGEHLPQRILSSSPAEFAGVLSYSIYLVHDLLGGLLDSLHHAATRHGLAHGQTYGAAVCFILTFPLAWLAYRLIEAPGRRLLRYAFEKDTRRPRLEQVFENKVEVL